MCLPEGKSWKEIRRELCAPENETAGKRVIVRNRAKCLVCGEILESRHRHDYKTCSCGGLSVDGGRDYISRAFREEGCFEELAEVKITGKNGGEENGEH